MTATTQAQASPKSSILPMTIIGVLFFIFGFVTWLNGSLIPFLKIICELNEFQALFVTFAFYIAYTVMALPMSSILKRTGYKNGMAIGLAIMVVGSLLFIPAAQSANYIIFLGALFVLGTGLTILQTASNPYVVHIGPKESAAMRISIMGLINKGAGVIVPILFTALVLSGFENFTAEHLAALSETERQAQISELSSRLVMPYIYMAIALTFLIGLVKFSSLPELEFEGEDEHQEKGSITHFPQVVLGAIALFAYVGVEVIAGDTIGLYGETLGVNNFASLTSYTMVFMVVGYIIGVTCIPKFISQEKALLGSAIAGILCVVGAALGSRESTMLADIIWGWSGIPVIPDTVTFVALMGLAHALVWPSIWPLALEGLGKYTAQGSALLIMGISGGAILPLVFGKVAYFADNTQVAYWVGLPCYLFILFYALKGHKMRSW
ncbi:sugar MFS transporter [Shewanella fidelis]|uniref:Sugar MFS transporter n=1 Tax=Shewanella fidelis TaxID=173509 RepID=A0AAW8NQS7_9GAMM|nr:sugar MFS transporter [Shewanella fidelis]MDR8524705.1 sugar MFS transporter [Shewanella fidelis]MDW4810776.1 sugar MFS transporter [Shewanella fidelis]MDW4815445.1 sugar MFS transporter [Shewanella fidelis]MDW4819535.1 sugar MFS transporter [Shewanella fidelis]MDW4822787.1 sugar MFS transporter [Shewanella fidelis]